MSVFFGFPLFFGVSVSASDVVLDDVNKLVVGLEGVLDTVLRVDGSILALTVECLLLVDVRDVREASDSASSGSSFSSITVLLSSSSLSSGAPKPECFEEVFIGGAELVEVL